MLFIEGLQSLMKELKKDLSSAGSYAEIRDIVLTAKRDATNYGQPNGGFNPMQFLMKMQWLETYTRLYNTYLERRMAKLTSEQRQKLNHFAWYYGLEPEERLAEQVKHMRKELREVKDTVGME